MIVLAAAVVITLNNTGIINKASDAVDKTNLNEVQNFATLVWSDEFMANKRGETLKADVLEKLKDSKEPKLQKLNNAYFFMLDNSSVKRVKDLTGDNQIGNISFIRTENLITTKIRKLDFNLLITLY